MPEGGAVGFGVHGEAVVVCVHDREKRKTLETEPFDPELHSPEVCVCCENIFLLRKGDLERHGLPLCDTCRESPVHPLAAPLKGESE